MCDAEKKKKINTVYLHVTNIETNIHISLSLLANIFSSCVFFSDA